MTPAATTLEDLNDRFGLGDELVFRAGAGGLWMADIANVQACASICLQGAQVLTWQPQGQAAPVIWLSAAAQGVRGKSLRGGVPVCWPWFGPHPGGQLPSHGFARNLDWQVGASGRGADGSTQITLRLQDSAQTLALWPHAFQLELHVRVGAALELELVTTNRSSSACTIGEALHTYFRIGDIAALDVLGLEGCAYVDSAAGARRGRQAGPIRFDAEFDRVYLDVPGAACIVDAQLGRRIEVRQTGARSTVVWNPWADKAGRLGDLGAGVQGQGGWRDMVCVESANALDNVVQVAPGATHALGVSYRVA